VRNNDNFKVVVGLQDRICFCHQMLFQAWKGVSKRDQPFGSPASDPLVFNGVLDTNTFTWPSAKIACDAVGGGSTKYTDPIH
jgi:hypothetical protein